MPIKEKGVLKTLQTGPGRERRDMGRGCRARKVLGAKMSNAHSFWEVSPVVTQALG